MNQEQFEITFCAISLCFLSTGDNRREKNINKRYKNIVTLPTIVCYDS